jgi:hypothetical protein
MKNIYWLLLLLSLLSHTGCTGPAVGAGAVLFASMFPDNWGRAGNNENEHKDRIVNNGTVEAEKPYKAKGLEDVNLIKSALKGNKIKINQSYSSNKSINNEVHLECNDSAVVILTQYKTIPVLVKDVLISELVHMGIYSEISDIVLDININEAGFSAKEHDWHISGIISASTGKRYVFKYKSAYEYSEDSFSEDEMCLSVQKALLPFWHGFTKHLLTDPAFLAILSDSNRQTPATVQSVTSLNQMAP